MASFARTERAALCTTARSVGPTAPTLCEGWTVLDLVCHLLVRERQPWAAVGVLVPALEPTTRRATAALAERPFGELLDQLAEPPLLLRPDTAERLVNGVEFFVHHEDIRRAQPSWTPRELSPDADSDLWRGLGLLGRMAGWRAGVPITVTDGSRTVALRHGESPVVLTGPVSELVMLLTGREQVTGVEWSGPPEQIEKLKAAKLGL